jgi:hypothetical protein
MPGCFEIFDATSYTFLSPIMFSSMKFVDIFSRKNLKKSFSCQVNTAHVTILGESAVEFCRTFNNTEELSNVNHQTWISSDYYKKSKQTGRGSVMVHWVIFVLLHKLALNFSALNTIYRKHPANQ